MTRPVEIPEEACAAGLAALHDDPEWHRADEIGVWRANYKRAVELVLEAAFPHLLDRIEAAAYEAGWNDAKEDGKL